MARDKENRQPRGDPHDRRLRFLRSAQQRTSSPSRTLQLLLALSLAATGSVGELAVRCAVATNVPVVSSPTDALNVFVTDAPPANDATPQLRFRVVPTRVQPLVPTYDRPDGY